MLYTIQATVEVAADSVQEAYGYIRHALEHARKAEIIHVDSEVIEERDEDGSPLEAAP